MKMKRKKNENEKKIEITLFNDSVAHDSSL